MHARPVALFGLCVVIAGSLFWMTALIVWPLPGRKRGCAGWPCAVLTAAAGCGILALGAGRLWYAGLCTAPLVFAVAALVSRMHHRQQRSEEDADG